MYRDERNLLEVLKFELQFLEKGGYGRSSREPWHPIYIFEDSPTCMNYDSKDNPEPCEACVLMQLVPAEFRMAEIPCRHIPLNAQGETLDSLYRYADQFEIEREYGKWLRATIGHLEEQRNTAATAPIQPVAGVGEKTQGVPLYQHIHPKCANPGCPIAFHWLAGGKFFRFRAGMTNETPNLKAVPAPGAASPMKHYWLCEKCSAFFTLAYEEGCGVILKLRLQELPATEEAHEIPAS